MITSVSDGFMVGKRNALQLGVKTDNSRGMKRPEQLQLFGSFYEGISSPFEIYFT